VPYSRAASEKLIFEYTNTAEKHGCNAENAIQLAKAAYLKSCELLLRDNSHNLSTYLNDISSVHGVGCTAALVSANPKRGDHRCHVAVFSNTSCDVYSITMNKGQRDRAEEDLLCSQLIVDAVMRQAGFPLRDGSLLASVQPASAYISTAAPLEQVTIASTTHDDPLELIYQRRAQHVLFIKRPSSWQPVRPHSAATPDSPSMFKDLYLSLADARIPAGSIIYPGSFNPLHEGHLALVRAAIAKMEGEFLAQAATRKRSVSDLALESTGQEVRTFRPPLVVFEIGALNADKPPLPREEIIRRLAQFDAENNPLLAQYGITNFAVSITSEPLFLEKSYIFKGCNFVIGADTMVRLVNSKYYVDPVVVPAGGEKRVGEMSVPGVISSSASASSSSGAPITTVRVDADGCTTTTTTVSTSTHTTTTSTTISTTRTDEGHAGQAPHEVPPSLAEQKARQERAQQRNITNMVAALTRIAENRCTFIVGGRAKTLVPAVSIASSAESAAAASTVFETCDMILRESYAGITGASAASSASTSVVESVTVVEVLPRRVCDMFRSLPEDAFRLDLSSTEIRNRLAAAPAGPK
jgi:hypothetical protein